MFVYLTEQEVKAALAQIATDFPRASIAFDTALPAGISRMNRNHARLKLEARFTWGCEDPREIERWKIGLRLVESRTLADVPDILRSRLSWRMRAVLRILVKLAPVFAKVCRLNLFAAEA